MRRSTPLLLASAGWLMLLQAGPLAAQGFSVGLRLDFGTGLGPSSVAIADVNGDGKLDLAVANDGSNTVSVMLGNGLTATVSVPAPGYGAPTDSVRFFDGFTLLGTSRVSGGVAVLSLPAPYLGDRSLTAVYKGNGRLFGSISPVRMVRVSPAQVGVGDGTPLAFALEGARPNPARGDQLSVGFALPSSAPAHLELLDVSGRRVVTRDVGELGAGPHVVELAADRALPPGLYLVRLTQGVHVRVTRVAVLK